MITIKIGQGHTVNLDSSTVESVTKGKKKGLSIVHIGTVAIEVEESPESLIKRIKADGGNPAVPEKKPKEHKEGAGEGEAGEAGGDLPPWEGEEEGDFLPPGGEGPGGLST